MNLAEFSVKYSIFGNMLTLFVLVGGAIMVLGLQRDTFPELELDLAVISTRYPNASAEEVENLVTNPLEDEIRDVDDIEEFTSSSVEGISVIVVQVDQEARYKERVFSEIQRKVDQVRDLPLGTEDPEVEIVTTRGPILRVCVTGTVSEQRLRDYGEYLRDRMKRIPDVSSVIKDGWRDEEFWVEVDLEKMESQEGALSDVVEALARRNVTRPGGKLPAGEQEIVLRTIGEFHTAEEIGDVVLRSNTDGNHIRVRDVATVRRTFEEDTVFSRANGTRTVVLGVKKKRSGDTISVADAVKKLLHEEQLRAPKGIALTYVDDESFYVKRRLQVLRSNGLVGFILVVAVLFLFMNFGVAMATGIGIPFSLLAALLLMSLFGITINLITMFGLIIVLGMLVDDSIIVGENIFRYMEAGMAPRAAAVVGTTEVMYPVISTVLTTIAAFAPLAFAPDVFGQIMRWFPIVVAIALGSSLLEAILVMPCHVADFVRPIRVDRRRNGAPPQAHRWMAKLNRVYTRLIRIALRWRYLFLAGVLVVSVMLGVVAKLNLRVDIFPADLIDVFFVRLSASQGTSLEATERITSRVEEVVRALSTNELENVVSYIGGHVQAEGGFSARGTHHASLVVYLTPQNTRPRKTQAIVEQLRAGAAGVEGIERIEFTLIEPGPPTGKPLEVRISGPEYGVLRPLSERIQAFLREQPGVFDIQDNYEEGKDEIHIRVDESEAARLGLHLDTIARIVRTAFLGTEATVVREGNDEVIVRVRLMRPYRDREDSLARLTVPNQNGRLIPLNRVARYERATGLPSIFHYDGERVVTVSANIDTEVISSLELNRKLEAAFASVPGEHPGYELLPAGEWKETRKLMIFMWKAFGMALLLVYVILAVQFNSFMQPFVVMVSIPLGLIGVVLALILHDKPVSIMAMMGIVGMCGVVVNDAIVLVSFVNDQRARGMALFDALVDAGQKRLRPILLTSVTTIAGLVPVIWGIGGYEPFVAPAAIALTYGLAFATVLTLFIVPAIYFVGHDARRAIGRRFRRAAPAG